LLKRALYIIFLSKDLPWDGPFVLKPSVKTEDRN